MSRLKRKIVWFLVLLTIALNVVAYFHAYKFTHFSTSK
jgi:hypothetical protein